MKKLICTSKRRVVNNTIRKDRVICRPNVFSIKKLIISSAALLIISLCINIIPTTVKADTCEPTTYKSVLVSEGDTLWDIAKEYHTENISIKRMVEEIKSINNISTDYIKGGNYLLVPIYK